MTTPLFVIKIAKYCDVGGGGGGGRTKTIEKIMAPSSLLLR